MFILKPRRNILYHNIKADFLVLIYTEPNRFQTLAGLSTIDQQTSQVSSYNMESHVPWEIRDKFVSHSVIYHLPVELVR